MRVRVLHAKLYAYALPGSTARQLFISSTLLDSSTATRQTSTDLDRTRRPGTWSQARQARQELDSNSTGSTGKASTAPRQRLDSASTEPRQLDSSTARAQVQCALWARSAPGHRPGQSSEFSGHPRPSNSHQMSFSARRTRVKQGRRRVPGGIAISISSRGTAHPLVRSASR